MFIINPWHACAARVTVLGLCVCVCVYAYSCATGNEAAYERYQQLQYNKRSKNKMVILLKRRRSRSRTGTVADHVAWTKLTIVVRACVSRDPCTHPPEIPDPRPPPSSLTPRRQRTCSQALLSTAASSLRETG